MTFGGISPIKQQQRFRAALFVALGGLFIFFAGLAFLFLNSDSTKAIEDKSVQPQAAQQIEMTEVLIPIQAIDVGKKLERTMFRKEQRPKVGVPLSAIRDFEEIQGFYAKSILSTDAAVVRDQITQFRPTNPLTPKIPEGFRAVTIRVDATTGVEGWAQPGARVDVVWTTTVRGERTLSTIVQNAQVISAASQMESPVKSSDKAVSIPTTVTLLVTAKDAQKILLAQSTGALSLSLRGDADKGKGQASGSITMKDLLPKIAEEQEDEPIDGTVKLKGADGRYETWVLRKGKLEAPKSK